MGCDAHNSFVCLDLNDTAMVNRFTRNSRILVAAIVLSIGASVHAQVIRGPLDRGFARTSSVVVTVDELLGSRQPRPEGTPLLGPGYPDLWMAEVQYKPIRYRRMQVEDPKTGTTRTELVWYLIYRVIPRDITELAGDTRDELIAQLEGTGFKPVNTVDASLYPSLQIPRFILRTDDREDSPEYIDEVNLQVQRQVLSREFQKTPNLKLLNSVEGIKQMSEMVSIESVDQLSNALYGVAVWRNVDPTTDFVTVRMTGFSNAYRIASADDGSLVVERKEIEQRFSRPGDEFDQQETEFRVIDQVRLQPNGDLVVFADDVVSTYRPGRAAPAFVGKLRKELELRVAAGRDPKITWPFWSYRPWNAKITVPKFERILRNDDSVTAEPAE